MRGDCVGLAKGKPIVCYSLVVTMSSAFLVFSEGWGSYVGLKSSGKCTKSDKDARKDSEFDGVIQFNEDYHNLLLISQG